MKYDLKTTALLYSTCFLTGTIILILEMLGFRIFAPYLGNSIYTSGSLIGIILTALSIGYYVGGKIADLYPREELIFYFTFFSGLYLLGVFFSYKLILTYFQNFDLTVGAILSTTVIFGVPMTLLSMTSPYLIKVMTSLDKIGESSGKIFSISTIGSISGSFISTFLLIPTYGSRQTLIICIISLFAISTIGLLKFKMQKKYLLVIFVPLLLLIKPYSENNKSLIHESESIYNLIRIYNKNKTLTMMINNPKWRQSYRPNMKKLKKSYREYFLITPFLTKVDSILILGMSAGASVHEFNHFFDVKIDAVEIDPEIVILAKKYFNIKEDEKFHIYTEDAKNYLTKSNKQYDFIEIDLFQGGAEIPFYVATKEFFEQVYMHTSKNGIIMMNVLGNYYKSNSNKLAKSIANTISTHFTSVYIMPVRNNTIIIASKNLTTLKEVKNKLASVNHKDLKYFSREMSKKLLKYTFNPEETIFTDDKSSIELIANQIARGK
ncbi:MAG: fused MFS/spermidine synthase [Bdellovibrionales bacterium]|jgi:spermidine synthase|nr:fused MFS/spermidine synthase [Bdellovibrionales bacterium]